MNQVASYSYYPPEHRLVKVIDRTLDLLIVMILLGAPLIFYTKGNDVFEFNKFTAVRDFSVLAITLFTAKLLYVRPLQLMRSATDLPLLLWIACCFVSTFHTADLRLSLHGVYEDFEGLTSLLNYAFLLFLMQQHVRHERQIKLFIGAVIIAGTLSGFYGMLQNFGIDFVPWNPATYSADRMFSTMGNPNFLAAYLVMSLPICLVVFLNLPTKISTDKQFCFYLVLGSMAAVVGLCILFNVNFFNFDPSYYEVSDTLHIFLTLKFWITHILLAFPLIAAILLYYGRLRDIILISMLFQVIAVLFTKSRGGGISLIVIYAIFVAYAIWDLRRGSKIWREQWNLISLGLFHLLLALALIFLPSVRDTTLHMFGRLFKLMSVSNIELTPRLYIWRSALQIMADHFWFGSGLDTFQIVFPQYRLSLYWILEWNGTPEKAHNMVMQIAATMGIMGLISFFWLNVSVIARVFRDLVEQMDESKRLLMVGCFAAAAAFFVQNLFSFTVVGYGSLYWMLMGFIPAMQRTWIEKQPVETTPGGSFGNANHEALVTWRASLIFLSLLGILALVAGWNFSMDDGFQSGRLGIAAMAVVALFMVAFSEKPADVWRNFLLGSVFGGLMCFAVYSTRTWVADTFYKQGQVGIAVGNPEFAAAMYQKAAGRIVTISPAQEPYLYNTDTPTAAAGDITFTAGLNSDQELYWVKMGIAFENAAAAAEKGDDKLSYYRTALAIHELTLQMNPINGYNYNNKGRVLKDMGEAFNSPDMLNRALAHYQKAIALDQNNVYFNLDYATTFIDIQDYADAMQVCQNLMTKYPDFAMSYSYAGFVKLHQNQPGEAIKYFNDSLSKDWKGDMNSKALAATNLGILLASARHYDDASAAFQLATFSNNEMPEPYLRWADMFAKEGKKASAISVLQDFGQRHPENNEVKAALHNLGVK